MIYLLLASAVSFALAYWQVMVQRQSQDDFIAGIVALVASASGAILLAIYLAAAFWNHRFW